MTYARIKQSTPKTESTLQNINKDVAYAKKNKVETEMAYRNNNKFKINTKLAYNTKSAKY